MIGLDDFHDEERGRLRRCRPAESDTGAANLIVSDVRVDRSATSLRTRLAPAAPTHARPPPAARRPRMVQARLVAKVNTGATAPARRPPTSDRPATMSAHTTPPPICGHQSASPIESRQESAAHHASLDHHRNPAASFPTTLVRRSHSATFN